MSNQGASNTKRSRTPALDHIANMMQRGWEDFRQSAAFPADYDLWPVHDQRNYESGRRMAATLSAFQPVAKWPRNRLLQSAVGRVSAAAMAALVAENRHSVADR